MKSTNISYNFDLSKNDDRRATAITERASLNNQQSHLSRLITASEPAKNITLNVPRF